MRLDFNATGEAAAPNGQAAVNVNGQAALPAAAGCTGPLIRATAVNVNGGPPFKPTAVNVNGGPPLRPTVTSRGAGGREQAMSRGEQGAGGREQGAGGREQGAGGREQRAAVIELHKGFSSSIALPTGIDLIIHEILGNVASAEGAIHAINELLMRTGLTSR